MCEAIFICSCSVGKCPFEIKMQTDSAFQQTFTGKVFLFSHLLWLQFDEHQFVSYRWDRFKIFLEFKRFVIYIEIYITVKFKACKLWSMHYGKESKSTEPLE